MRYVKTLVLVLIFFVAMIFLFQNQGPLSQKITFELNLLVMPSMKSIELPFYFVLLAGFLLGALLCMLLLLWDRARLSAQILRANWRVQALENEERKLLSQMEKLAAAPREGGLKLFSGFFGGSGKKEKKEEKADAAGGRSLLKKITSFMLPDEEEKAREAGAQEKKDGGVNEFFAEPKADGAEGAQAGQPASDRKEDGKA